MVVRLLEATEDLIVEKIRWKLGRWELDRFLGTLEGSGPDGDRDRFRE